MGWLDTAIERYSKIRGSAASDQAITAALIAIGERMDVQNEHLEHIRDHLDDIGTVLKNVSNEGKGHLSVESYNWDARRELG